MRGLYQSSVSAAPLTARYGLSEVGGPATEGDQRGEGKLEVVELAGGVRVTLPRPLCSAEEEQQRQKHQKPAVHIEKVVNAWGSAAGAGSDFFDCYRRTRNVEMRRVEKMEEEFRKKVETEEFQLLRHRRMEEAAKKNAAARERRRRRKIKQQEQQRSRSSTKKSDAGAADPSSVSNSADAPVGDNSSCRADAGAPVSGEATRRANSSDSEAEGRHSLHSPAVERRVRRPDKRRRDSKENEGGDSVSSQESDGTECGSHDDGPRQNRRRKRHWATGEKTEQHSSVTAQTGHCSSQTAEGTTPEPAEAALRVNTLAKEEDEDGKGKGEDEGACSLPLMKAGMITVHDDDW